MAPADRHPDAEARCLVRPRRADEGGILLVPPFCYTPGMKSFFDEFKKFALRGNAIDLAVGVVIGAAFNAITTSLVTNVITPPLSLLTRGINFADLAIAIPNTDATIQYGLFIQAIITFIITAFALFLLVKAINSLVAKAKKDEEEGKIEPAPKSPELTVLEEIRDSLKKESTQ